MIGNTISLQWDREVNITKADSIAMGAYSIDIIPVSQSSADGGNSILREGGIQAPSFLPPSLPPFQVCTTGCRIISLSQSFHIFFIHYLVSFH